MDFEIEEEIVKTFMDNISPKEIKRKTTTEIVKITSNEAKEGTEKLVEINHANVCNKCYGKGKIKEVSCKECYGRGFKFEKEKIKVKIPKGIKENDIIVLKSKGNLFETEEIRGDAQVKIHIFGKKSKRKGDFYGK